MLLLKQVLLFFFCENYKKLNKWSGGKWRLLSVEVLLPTEIGGDDSEMFRRSEVIS